MKEDWIDDNEEIQHTKVSLEKFKIVALQYLPGELLCGEEPQIDVSLWSGYFANQFAIRITKKIWGREMQEKEVQYPSNWWEAIKDRWAPRWIKNRWPIKYTVEKLTARELYPHMIFSSRPGRSIVILGGNIPHHMDQRMIDEAQIGWAMRQKAKGGTIRESEIEEIVCELLKRMSAEEVEALKKKVMEEWWE